MCQSNDNHLSYLVLIEEIKTPYNLCESRTKSLMLVKLTNISFVGLLHELLLFKQAAAASKIIMDKSHGVVSLKQQDKIDYVSISYILIQKSIKKTCPRKHEKVALKSSIL